MGSRPLAETCMRRAAVLALAASVIAVVGQTKADGNCVTGSGVAGTNACASRARDSVLLQTYREVGAELSVLKAHGIRSDDVVFLKVSRTGRRITCEQDGLVHAPGSHAGSRQELKIVREAGAGPVQSGDAIFIWNHWDKTLTVEGTTVHSKWSTQWGWERMIITTPGGGQIMAGSRIFLEAHTGNMIDADAPDSPGVVQARFPNKDTWEELIIEKKEAPTTTPTTRPPTTTTPTTRPPTTTRPREKVSTPAWENLMLVNELRKSGFTCPGGNVYAPNEVPMKFDCKLWKASQSHSQDMADNNYFSHYSQDGRSPWDRAEEWGTTANGENIAAGSSTAAGALEQWKNSDGHCKLIMNPAFEVLSVGYAAGGRYGHYWTQMFRRVAGEVDTWCYPAASLAQAGEADQRRGGQQVLGDGGEEPDPSGQDEVIGEPWTDSTD